MHTYDFNSESHYRSSQYTGATMHKFDFSLSQIGNVAGLREAMEKEHKDFRFKIRLLFDDVRAEARV
jgi:hypothetical protein